MTELQMAGALIGALAEELEHQEEVVRTGTADEAHLAVAGELSDMLRRVIEDYARRVSLAGAAGLISGAPPAGGQLLDGGGWSSGPMRSPNG